jgi:surface antigen
MQNTNRHIRYHTSLILAGVILFGQTLPALADQFDVKINALRQQISAQQQQVNQLNAQQNTLANKIQTLNTQAEQTSNQIALTEARYNQTVADIAETKQKLADKKAQLAENLKLIYQQSQVTTVEMLASSNSFGDFLDRQQYLESMKIHMDGMVTEMSTTKVHLEDQQSQLANLLSQQQGLSYALGQQRSESSTLLAQSQGQEANYQNMIQANTQQVATLKAQQAAAIAAASRHVSGGSSAGCGGYPSSWCNAPQDSLIDSWGMYNRECVSYAAWAATYKFGHFVPYWGGRGNANQWPGNARGAGIPVDGSPRVGDVAIYSGGPYGHAMVVESVNGATVRVSSFNADNTGHYSVDDWPVRSLQFIHFR